MELTPDDHDKSSQESPLTPSSPNTPIGPYFPPTPSPPPSPVTVAPGNYTVLKDRLNQHSDLVRKNLKPLEKQPYIDHGDFFFVFHRHSADSYAPGYASNPFSRTLNKLSDQCMTFLILFIF
jgi:hypothetical protein